MHFPVPVARHGARSRRASRVVAAVGVLSAAFGIAIVVASADRPPVEVAESAMTLQQAPPMPAKASTLPVPEQSAVPATTSICDLPTMTDALASGTTSEVADAAGGAEQLRTALASGEHGCLSLNDPNKPWFVVNKLRPFENPEWEPTDVVVPATFSQVGSGLRAEPAAAFDAMAAASVAEGGGSIALNSGFRSFSTQVASYDSQVEAAGQTEADHASARPGHSEHQTGLTADIVPCNPTCGTLDDVAGSTQGAWIAANSWRFGWIVRYEDGYTDTTGYEYEPWHLRYIGVELAQAYHDGGYKTLEDFFELAPAPDYLG